MRNWIDLFETELDETGGAKMSRMLRQMKRPFAVISAYTGSDQQDNTRQTVSLLRDLLALGLGGTEMAGRYEDDGYSSEEVSFFVPYREASGSLEEFKQNMSRLGTKYHQRAILFGDGKSVMNVTPEGDTYEIGNAATMDPNKMAKMWGEMNGTLWSERKGRKFMFANKERWPNQTLDPDKLD